MKRLENKKIITKMLCQGLVFLVLLLGLHLPASAKSDKDEKVLQISEILENRAKYEDKDVLVLVEGKIGFGTDTIELWEDFENGPSILISLGKIDYSDPGFDRKHVILQGKIKYGPCKFEVGPDEPYHIICGIYLVVYGIIHID